jgi:hypothetical protein
VVEEARNIALQRQWQFVDSSFHAQGCTSGKVHQPMALAARQ